MAQHNSIFDDQALNGEDAIIKMFEMTDENGKLYIQDYDSSILQWKETDLALTMDWKNNSSEPVLEEYKDAIECIKAVSDTFAIMGLKYSDDNIMRVKQLVRDKMREYSRNENNKKLELTQKLFSFIGMFLEPWVCLPEVPNVEAKLNKIVWKLNLEYARTHAINTEICLDNSTTEITEEEQALYNEYLEMHNGELVIRVGEGCDSDNVINYARKLLELMVNNAPAEKIKIQQRKFAQVLAVHRCAEKFDKVIPMFREKVEAYEEMSDKEQDKLYDSGNVNKLESLLPVFIMEILRSETDINNPLDEKTLEEKVKDQYGIGSDSKTFKRVLNTLCYQAPLGVKYIKKFGFWYDKPLF